MLFAASRIQSKLAAIHIELEKGIAIKAKLAIKAPIKKTVFFFQILETRYHRLLPQKRALLRVTLRGLQTTTWAIRLRLRRGNGKSHSCYSVVIQN